MPPRRGRGRVSTVVMKAGASGGTLAPPPLRPDDDDDEKENKKKLDEEERLAMIAKLQAVLDRGKDKKDQQLGPETLVSDPQEVNIISEGAQERKIIEFSKAMTAKLNIDKIKASSESKNNNDDEEIDLSSMLESAYKSMVSNM